MKGSTLSAAGSAQFKAPKRPELFSVDPELPGPGEYNAKAKEGFGSSEIRQNAFGVKTKRFGSDDTIVPGPGQYVPQKQACNVKEAKRPHAGMLSGTDRAEFH